MSTSRWYLSTSLKGTLGGSTTFFFTLPGEVSTEAITASSFLKHLWNSSIVVTVATGPVAFISREATSRCVSRVAGLETSEAMRRSSTGWARSSKASCCLTSLMAIVTGQLTSTGVSPVLITSRMAELSRCLARYSPLGRRRRTLVTGDLSTLSMMECRKSKLSLMHVSLISAAHAWEAADFKKTTSTSTFMFGKSSRAMLILIVMGVSTRVIWRASCSRRFASKSDRKLTVRANMEH
mmetsp:Transcript_28687/g.63681  ORF Transcript_28687/g.63681 Transcript_28687/m.63681 type:complete len:238 (+) Transcript_28687:666-1379(+)